MQSLKNYIKTIIVDEVFVRGSERQIISPEGKVSDWIFDFRKSILKPEALDAYATLFLERHSSKYPYQVGGLEVSAIPLIAAIVMKSLQIGTPVNGFFVRKSRKKKGLLNVVEGTINDTPIILVDDIMNSGGSFAQQIAVLEDLQNKKIINTTVDEVFSIVQFRDTNQYEYLTERNIAVEAMFTLNDLHEELSISNLVSKNDVPIINPFKVAWCFRGGSPHLWQVQPKSAPILHNGMIFFGTDSGYFLCLDAKSGKELWSYFVAFAKEGVEIFSSPQICKDIVVFGCHDGNVYALDIASGKRVWVNSEADWVHGSLAYADNLEYIFAPLSFGLLKKRGKVVALDASSGKKKWEFTVNTTITSSIKYSKKHGMIFFGTDDGLCYGLSAKDGSCTWKKELQIATMGAPCVDDASDSVIFGGVTITPESGNMGGVYVCDTKTGKEKSVFRELSFGSYSTPITHNGRVFVSSLDKFLYCFDMRNGKLLWKAGLDARCFASPVLVQCGEKMHIFIGANNGRLHEIDALSGKILSVTYLPERIVDRVASDEENEMIFAPTFANEVYALMLSQ